jgi:putative spermidine/putrescine transport system substrate-binding protein
MLAYDGNKLADGPKNWADFFDTKKFPGKRALRNNVKWSLEIALLADGVPQDQVYKLLKTPEGVDRAFAKLDTIKKDLVFWKSGGQPIEMLASGDVVMAAAYNGRIFNANKKDGKNFKVVWKDSPYTMDSWVIMKGSPNKDEALKLIEFMGRPENQAKMVPYSPYGTTAVGADALVDATLVSQLPTAPANLAVVFHEDAQFWNDNGDKLAERWAAWTGTN